MGNRISIVVKRGEKICSERSCRRRRVPGQAGNPPHDDSAPPAGGTGGEGASLQGHGAAAAAEVRGALVGLL
jgi:hypothetical protein